MCSPNCNNRDMPYAQACFQINFIIIINSCYSMRRINEGTTTLLTIFSIILLSYLYFLLQRSVTTTCLSIFSGLSYPLSPYVLSFLSCVLSLCAFESVLSCFYVLWSMSCSLLNLPSGLSCLPSTNESVCSLSPRVYLVLS